MPVGWQTVTDSGVVQIDQDTKCYQLVTKGSGTFNSIVPMEGGGGYAVITVTNAVAPLLAIQFTTPGGHAVRKIHVSGTTWNYYISGAYGEGFTYYVFDHVTTLVENFGLAIYDAAGVLAFQSGGKPMRIVGNGPGTYAGGRTYAAVCLEFRTVFASMESEDVPGDYLFDYYAYGPAQDANVFAHGTVGISAGDTTGAIGWSDWDDTPAGFLVVDVTNY